MELDQAKDCSPIDPLLHLTRIIVSPENIQLSWKEGMYTKLRKNPGNEYLTVVSFFGDEVLQSVDLQDRHKD